MQNTKQFDWDVGGPTNDEHPLPSMTDAINAGDGVANEMPSVSALKARLSPWDEGWYEHAIRKPAHPGRVGLSIAPEVVVVHTTDMLPNSFDALVSSWASTKGTGCCAHFNLGRTPEQGLVQQVPINRNGNHAGGAIVRGKAQHGWWSSATRGYVHPNTVAVGIEVHSAGKLRWKKNSGNKTAEYIEWPSQRVLAEFPREECYIDEMGRPWHKVTEYQLDVLGALLEDLKPALKTGNITYAPNGDYPVGGYWDATYAFTPYQTLVGHVTIDPVNKTDPGPQVMAYIKSLAAAGGWR